MGSKNGELVYNIPLNFKNFVPIVIYNSLSWIKNETLPYMLNKITNEYGGVISINYTASTLFNNSENGVSELGFNIYLVNDVVTNNTVDNFASIISSRNYSQRKCTKSLPLRFFSGSLFSASLTFA